LLQDDPGFANVKEAYTMDNKIRVKSVTTLPIVIQQPKAAKLALRLVCHAACSRKDLDTRVIFVLPTMKNAILSLNPYLSKPARIVSDERLLALTETRLTIGDHANHVLNLP
jgi:hypothetical protein